MSLPRDPQSQTPLPFSFPRRWLGLKLLWGPGLCLQGQGCQCGVGGLTRPAASSFLSSCLPWGHRPGRGGFEGFPGAAGLRSQTACNPQVFYQSCRCTGYGPAFLCPRSGCQNWGNTDLPVPSQPSQDRGHELEPSVRPRLPLGYLYPFPGGAGSLDIPRS